MKSKKIKIRKLQFKTYNQTVEIPIRRFLAASRKEPFFGFNFALARKTFFKFAAFILIVALNRAAFLTVGQTSALFSDKEDSAGNSFTVSNLDFSLNSEGDFPPLVKPDQPAGRTINLLNDGLLGFNYTANASSADGVLCDYLNLEAKLNGVPVYNGPLVNFRQSVGEFSTTTKDWQFIAALTKSDEALEGQACRFDFVFDAEQIEGPGFSDREIIQNTITSGIWHKKVLINKVYYNVDDKHGVDPKNEWIELYNSATEDVNLKKWKICDNNDCVSVDPNVSIPALGFALISHDADTWRYWQVIDGVPMIYQLGGSFALNNTANALILKNDKEIVVDQMNWGVPTSTWPNYNPELWNPGVLNVEKGHMLGRVPAGFDTDSVSDWHDLGLPQVSLIWPNGGEVLWVGQTATLKWSAQNPNGLDSDLKISIWYSKDSGNTWARIATSTENDGVYDWRIPLCLDNGYGGCYYTPSHKARIKVAAFGPENFMVQGWDMSDADFCPPVDYNLLTQEEKDQIKYLMAQGIIYPDEIINFEAAAAGKILGTETAFTDGKNTAEENATTTENIQIQSRQENTNENQTAGNPATENPPVEKKVPEETIPTPAPAPTAEEQSGVIPEKLIIIENEKNI